MYIFLFSLRRGPARLCWDPLQVFSRLTGDTTVSDSKADSAAVRGGDWRRRKCLCIEINLGYNWLCWLYFFRERESLGVCKSCQVSRACEHHCPIFYSDYFIKFKRVDDILLVFISSSHMVKPLSPPMNELCRCWVLLIKRRGRRDRYCTIGHLRARNIQRRHLSIEYIYFEKKKKAKQAMCTCHIRRTGQFYNKMFTQYWYWAVLLHSTLHRRSLENGERGDV